MGENNPTSAPVLYLVVKQIPEVADTKMSKNENECRICGIPFSSKGASQTQKHVCRFCFHAVCAACSPLTALHPTSNNSERICLICYTHYLRIHIQDENTPKTQEKIQEEIQKFQRDSLEVHLQKVEGLKTSLKEREKHFQDQITRLSMEVQERETRIMTMSFSNEENGEGEKDSIAKYLQQMKEVETENLRLKKELDGLKNTKSAPPAVAQKQGCCCSIY